MKLSAEKLIGIKAQHDTAELTEHRIDDILFNMYDHRLCYFTFSVENNSYQHEEMPADQHMETVVAATSGIGTQNTPLTGSAYPETNQNYKKETYYIPWHRVKEFNEDRLLFAGNEQQRDEPIECYSFQAIKDLPVIDQDGEKIGKINDLIVDTDRQQVIGFSLSEGFWKSLFGHSDKFMPVSGNLDWKNQEWKIERTSDLLLKDSSDEL
ncbi:PRC-barrel domain-containing protein [Fictibacillus barbaricus]|uniref:PRC-barrel domain-containing protein n=1 Tax=Fictibacillus barbaricus TaxID=182136 RepID=A0ABS2ZH53_9BACL|nr:PRC-barrel domain-containing protein [Fictibacillus barbaricus]MBN3547275.1 PRC-barrel domain-containing protein [Fictibacillus barbaricus]GGB47775.1 hypothetical protein GCM10007199_11560 [Fictibacillus barbaricus]